MNKEKLTNTLSSISLSFFRKDFFGIYHGSISAKTDTSRFIINKKDAVFDHIDSSLLELYYNKDYRWNEASIDADIHLEIYKHISDAKYITFTMPPYTTAYSIDHSVILAKDFFGSQNLKTIEIYNPKTFEDWYDRASTEITQYFLQNNTNIMVIKGYGVYAYHRDLGEMAKTLAILEKSCRLLMLDSSSASLDLDF